MSILICRVDCFRVLYRLILLYRPNASHAHRKCEVPNVRPKIMTIVYFNLIRMLINYANVHIDLDLN